MAHPYHHAISSAKQFGGKPEDYLPIHNWFDATKAHVCDFRHRALRHHSQGIYDCEQVFGTTITNSNGKEVPTRLVGEQHVREDLGFIPSVGDWLRHLQAAEWMNKPIKDPHLNPTPLPPEPTSWHTPAPIKEGEES
ncbi:MAG: hypothetical protein KDB07_06615 [Planctomycetes bacterium]|nr:hypothetical protein [Planctomycetota bacterium]